MQILITVTSEDGEAVAQYVDLSSDTPATAVLDATATAIRRAHADWDIDLDSDVHRILDGSRGVSEGHLLLARIDAEGTSY